MISTLNWNLNKWGLGHQGIPAFMFSTVLKPKKVACLYMLFFYFWPCFPEVLVFPVFLSTTIFLQNKPHIKFTQKYIYLKKLKGVRFSPVFKWDCYPGQSDF